MRTVLRTAVPVDDGLHEVDLRGPVLHVATRHEDIVEFWHLHDDQQDFTTSRFFVVGTGHATYPEKAEYVGSAVTPTGRFVWHLWSLKGGAADG